MSIVLENVGKAFGDKSVIVDLNWQLPERGIIGLSGPSGCGKTTLLRLLAGLTRPDRGRILGLDDLPVSMVFQEDRLLPWLSVMENVCLVAEDRAAAELWLDRVRLTDCAGQYPDALSGGMKRRLALARALARPAGLLLLDEPLTGMDSELKAALYGLIRQAAATCTVVLVTHDSADLEKLADNLLLADGPPLRLQAK